MYAIRQIIVIEISRYGIYSQPFDSQNASTGENSGFVSYTHVNVVLGQNHNGNVSEWWYLLKLHFVKNTHNYMYTVASDATVMVYVVIYWIRWSDIDII